MPVGGWLGSGSPCHVCGACSWLIPPYCIPSTPPPPSPFLPSLPHTPPPHHNPQRHSALSALASNHKPTTIAAAGEALAAAGLPHAFQLLEDLTRVCLAAGGASGSDAAEPWVSDCTEMLLDAWSSALAPQCGYAMAAVGPPAGAAGCAAQAFGALVEAALQDAAAGAHEVGFRY